MRRTLVHLLLVSSLSIGLSSCAPETTGSATPKASAELDEIIANELTQLNPDVLSQEEREDLEQMSSLIETFRKTHDVNVTAPKTKLTLLHLAAAYKKEELVRCLLLDGADPNAQRLNRNNEGELVQGDTPLTYAAAAGFTEDEDDEESQQTSLRIIKMLIDKGGDMTKRGIYNALPVEIAALAEGREALILELLKLTPKSSIAPPLSEQNRGMLLHAAAHFGYSRLMEKLIKLGYDPNTRLYNEQVPLITLVNVGRANTEDKHKTIEVLLKHGANINLTDNQGRTPLFSLAFIAQSQTPDINKEMDMAAQIIFMLERGARTDMASGEHEEYPGFTPYDLLSLRPQLLAELAKRGFPLQSPPLVLPESDTALLATLCRVTQTGIDFSQLQQKDLDHIASILLSPSDAMLHHELYEPALKSAITILHQLDQDKTRDILNQLPFWNPPSPSLYNPAAKPSKSHLMSLSCKGCGHESHILRPILESITEQKDWIIPSAKILVLTQSLIEENHDELALTCMQLLARCPDSSQYIDTLLRSDNAVLRLGAHYARLLTHGLPLPEEHSVHTWLHERERVAQTPFLKKALLLTSLEELWFGNMPQEEIDLLLASMVEIGAHQAAEQYKRIIPLLKNPEKLDEIMSGDQSWQYELNEAIAAYFFEHRKQFKAELE